MFWGVRPRQGDKPKMCGVAALHPPLTLLALQGLLALLEEDDSALQAHALKQLYVVVDQYWAEVANAVPLIEELSEDQAFEVGLSGVDRRRACARLSPARVDVCVGEDRRASAVPRVLSFIFTLGVVPAAPGARGGGGQSVLLPPRGIQ